MRLWFDLDNLPDVNVFAPMIRNLNGYEPIVTTRKFSDLDGLLTRRGFSSTSIGSYYGSSMIAKAIGTLDRTARLIRKVPPFDAAIASLAFPVVLASRIRGKSAIAFLDGDIVTANLRSSAPFVDRLFVPETFDDAVLERFGLSDRTVRYDGFKEDLAVADYSPDPSFLSEIPFEEYVLVRPEALKAEYVSSKSGSIVPKLLNRLGDAGFNILYLPRYPEDRQLHKKYGHVFVPDQPVNGVDACYHARAVLTGSGTLAREAAVLGVPAASFFPGPRLLSVDAEMIRRGWMTHSRNPETLVDFVLESKQRPFDRQRSQGVFASVIRELESILLGHRAA